ncbi:MAG: hypothetical protein JSV16_13300 [Candidatus Hydrogenedentota bacterium]|nr:MAG: hypothetical protein JSV16_13300 [Candidatus Hydrogenedentota bacterium]
MQYIAGVSESLAIAARQWRVGDILALGNGPSLDAVDFSKVTIPTMGINRSCRVHVSEFHTMHDHPNLWKAYDESLPRSRDVPYPEGFALVEGEGRRKRGNILFLFDPCNRSVERWMCRSIGIDFVCHSSGEYALVATAFLGFRKRIWVIGFDSNDNQGHAKSLITDEDTFIHDRTKKEKNYAIDRERLGHARHFNLLAKEFQKIGVEVFNCNPGSAIKCWPFVTD